MDEFKRQLPSLQWKNFKKHRALWPLFAVTAIGGGWCGYYVCRLALKSPDVQWTRSDKDPLDRYEKKQYKFYSNIDHEKLPPKPTY